MTPLLKAAASAPQVPARELLCGRPALVVVAPHPDDETLGCGALLHDAAGHGIACGIVCVTDGSKSHRDSPSWSPARLAGVRRAEMRAAVACLAPGACVDELGYPDCETPCGGRAATECVDRLDALVPPGALVLSTWGGDPHVDHRRTADLVRRLARRRPDLAVLFYPIWGRLSPAMPGGRILRLSASAAAGRAKRAALACHRSQMTRLIEDDPEGFVMSQADQSHFLEHPEIFIAG